MKYLVIFLLATLPLIGCKTKVVVQDPVVVVEQAPPPDKPETRSKKPRGRYAWIPGHWEWNGIRWTWYEGHWRRIKRGHTKWVPVSWKRKGKRWIRTGGHWH